MILLIPDNRVCPNKETKYPVTSISPILWIKTDSADYTVVSIDGFIVTNERKVNGIFKKFEYQSEAAVEDIAIDDINSVFSESEIRLLKDFSQVMNCGFFTFIWPENFPEGYEQSAKLIHSYTFNFNDGHLEINTHKLISIEELEDGIRKLRGYSFKTVKSLNAASSNVECYLANNTLNPWPGDIDTIIYDKVKGKYLAIVEFKTHNLDQPIEQEHIGKYGDQDWRRFNVLFDLADNFNEKLGYKPKLFFIVWGTNPDLKNHTNIKIDLIERDKILRSFLFPRPAYNQFSDDLFKFILKEANETAI
ncbi:hypothetical protein [Mucilaginibacter boryungensis]|uniref:PD-(D/E)XK nuclease superfamily protein n=1 Tax=Mucilaginibacter boryungensis TaxID=768480 RepID=A0ABR9XM04_9SPHI|nr:hypothetical protein [Mucilaginibacter boryungensis]MBE9668089.1 hypothetical protein [Mucilaginibacter boryungensis]